MTTTIDLRVVNGIQMTTYLAGFARCWGSVLRSVQFAWGGGGSKWQRPQMWIIVVVIEIRDVSRIGVLCLKKKMNPVELHPIKR